jgi:hypothetical protein
MAGGRAELRVRIERHGQKGQVNGLAGTATSDEDGWWRGRDLRGNRVGAGGDEVSAVASFAALLFLPHFLIFRNPMVIGPAGATKGGFGGGVRMGCDWFANENFTGKKEVAAAVAQVK